MRVDLMTFGLPLAQAQALARAAADTGFDGLVVTEGGRTAYLTCAAAALAAPVDLATGIAVAFPRSPMVTAQVAWELAEASGGRFRLGLGTQVRAHVTRRYGAPFDPPGPRLRDYVGAVKACFAAFRAGGLDYRGEFTSLTLLPAAWSPGPIGVDDPPVEIAAVNPWMLRMAGEVADGVHIHPLNSVPYLDEVVRPELAAGARAAGRDPGGLAVTVPVLTAAGDTEAEQARWRERARGQVAFYGSTPNYAFVFDGLGFEGTTAALRARQKAGDPGGMVQVITDDILDHFVVTGTFAELPGRIAERLGGRADRAVLYYAATAWGEDQGALEAYGQVAREVRALTGD